MAPKSRDEDAANLEVRFSDDTLTAFKIPRW